MTLISLPDYLTTKGLESVLKKLLHTQHPILLCSDTNEIKAVFDSEHISLIITDISLYPMMEAYIRLNPKVRLIVMAEQPPVISAEIDVDVLVYHSDEKQVHAILKQNLAMIYSHLKSENKTAVLSDREEHVLRSVAMGKTNKEIADHLCISTHTVITHRKNITRKLGIKTVSGLTVYAMLHNLINVDQM